MINFGLKCVYYVCLCDNAFKLIVPLLSSVYLGSNHYATYISKYYFSINFKYLFVNIIELHKNSRCHLVNLHEKHAFLCLVSSQ